MKHLLIDKRYGWELDEANRTIRVSEKIAGFDTSYTLKNPQTLIEDVFDFSHSTGPEFDPETRWVYKSKKSGLTLEVCNDAEITKLRSKAYLDHKLNRD